MGCSKHGAPSTALQACTRAHTQQTHTSRPFFLTHMTKKPQSQLNVKRLELTEQEFLQECDVSPESLINSNWSASSTLPPLTLPQGPLLPPHLLCCPGPGRGQGRACQEPRQHEQRQCLSCEGQRHACLGAPTAARHVSGLAGRSGSSARCQ